MTVIKMSGVFLMVSLLAGSALAHGGGVHLMGTVKAVGDSTFTVTTVHNRQVRVVYDEKTSFRKSGAKSSVKELKVGQRVVVHATKRGNVLHATLVKFGRPPRKTRS